MSAHREDQFIEIGVAGRPHGTGGEFRVFLYNNESSLLFSEKYLFVKTDRDDTPIKRKIRSVRANPKHLIVSLVEVRHMDQAELLKGAKILLPRQVLPRPDADEFYVEELMGMEIHQRGVLLGTITSSRAQGGIEVVTVQNVEVEFEVPLVDVYVERMDIQNRVIHVIDTDDLPRSPRSNRGK